MKSRSCSGHIATLCLYPRRQSIRAHKCGELLTVVYCRLLEFQRLALCSYQFICLTYLAHCSNLNSKLVFVNSKNRLDHAFRAPSNSFIFYITVEECWRKRYICIAYSLESTLVCYIALVLLLLYTCT